MKHILVVEDEQAIADIIATSLEDEGYRVTIVHNGLEALNSLGRLRPDLVLTDLMMPLMNGLELCVQIRRGKEKRRMPVILMSAAMEQPVDENCGYDAFLRKPFDLIELFDMVERVIA